MEKRDLYDENKNLTGETIFKGEEVPKGRYYITVIMWIQNSKGEFLLQQKSKKKMGNGLQQEGIQFQANLVNREFLQK